MPKFNVTVPHTLSHEEVIDRLSRFEPILREKFKDYVSDLEMGWEGEALAFRCKSFGVQITGKVEALDKEVVVSGDLPFTAMMFKGKIESEFKRQLERLMTVGIIKKE